MPLFRCPHCAQSIDASDDFAGMEAACPTCEKTLVIPSTEPAADPPAEPAVSAPALPKLTVRSPLPTPPPRSPLGTCGFKFALPNRANPPPLMPEARFQPVFPFQPDSNLGWAGPIFEAAPPLTPKRKHLRHAYRPLIGNGGEIESDSEETDVVWSKRILCITLIAWAVMLGVNLLSLGRASYAAGGLADGSYRYAVAQSVIWVLLGSAIATLAAGTLSLVGLFFRFRAGRIWGAVHVGVMALLTLAHLVIQNAPKGWGGGAQDAPFVAFFAPDPAAGETFLSRPGLPDRLVQLTTELHQLCSANLYPTPPEGSDLAKFRWFVINQLQQRALSDEDRRFFQGEWAEGIDFEDPAWYTDNANLDKFIDKLDAIKEKAREQRNLCQESSRSFSGRLAAVHFSRAIENTMQGHVAPFMTKHLSVYGRLWQDLIVFVDDLADAAKYQRAFNDSKGLSVTHADAQRVLERLKSSMGNIAIEFISEADALPGDVKEVEAALTDNPLASAQG